MPYITVMQTPRTHQITLEEIILGTANIYASAPSRKITGTVTHFVERVHQKYLDKLQYDLFKTALQGFSDANAGLFAKERQSLYRTFYIPKKTRGYRKINEPVPALMAALRGFKAILERFGGPLYHTAAFAYIPGRCTIDAVKKHQQNRSRWFLKTDFADFFGSTTEDFVYKIFSMVFPFSEYLADDEISVLFRQALSLCFLDGGLPQGTPVSP